MSNYKPVYVNIWNDCKFIEFSPQEQLVFLYLITNPMTKIAGIYPVSPKQIFCSTNIEVQDVHQILRNFDPETLEYDFDKGVVYVKNYFKYNLGTIGNPKVAHKAIMSNAVLVPHERFWTDFNKRYEEKIKELNTKVNQLLVKKHLNIVKS